MDKIYVELLQKDSLMAQSILNKSKEIKLYELVDSAKKDTRLLKTSVNSLNEYNLKLRTENRKNKDRLKNTRLIAIATSIIATLLIVTK